MKVDFLSWRKDECQHLIGLEKLLEKRRMTFQGMINGVAVPKEYVQEYKFSDENGNYRLQSLRKRGSGSKRQDRPNMYYTAHMINS